MIWIDFHGSTHGHFLEYVINAWIMGMPRESQSVFTNTGACHNFSEFYKNNKMNILIPMAGAGSRFEAAGYTFPKPLIDVNGKPMIQTVVENLNIEGTFIFVVQKAHQ